MILSHCSSCIRRDAVSYFAALRGKALMDWLWAIVGSGLGGMARYAVSGAVARRIGETFPWGTLAVNASGSLVIGLFAGLVAPLGALPGNNSAALFVMTLPASGAVFCCLFPRECTESFLEGHVRAFAFFD